MTAEDVLSVLAARCRTQVAEHLGYEPDADDVADLRRLADKFGLTLPAPYDEPC